MKTKPGAEFILLGILMSGPKHGYEIKRRLADTAKATWQVSTSQIYALLKRLEITGQISAAIETQTTRPSRRVFTLTTAGKADFERWLLQPVRHVRDFRMEFITKLHFLHSLGLGGGSRLIERQIAVLENRRSMLAQHRTAATNDFTTLVFTFKLTSTNSVLEWLEQYARPFFVDRNI